MFLEGKVTLHMATKMRVFGRLEPSLLAARYVYHRLVIHCDCHPLFVNVCHMVAPRISTCV